MSKNLYYSGKRLEQNQRSEVVLSPPPSALGLASLLCGMWLNPPAPLPKARSAALLIHSLVERIRGFLLRSVSGTL